MVVTSKVLEPLSIRSINLRNRLVLPPMQSGAKCPDGHVVQATLDHYDKLSRGGYLSLIIVEHCFVDIQGRANIEQLSIADDSCLPGLRALTDLIHKNGSSIVAQISHAGGVTSAEVTGQETVGPSQIAYCGRPGPDRAMTAEDILHTVKCFGQAAVRAKAAGFDGVEIHSAHRYLLDQFYSPLANHRTDDYGGPVKNRLRIHLEILQEVRQAVGNSYPVFLRLGACDYMDGGNTISDAVAAARILMEGGVDVLDISGGMNGYVVKGAETIPGYFSDITAAIKKVVSIPVLLTGGITSINDAEQLLLENKADLIGIGRAMLRDPSWAQNALLSLS